MKSQIKQKGKKVFDFLFKRRPEEEETFRESFLPRRFLVVLIIVPLSFAALVWKVATLQFKIFTVEIRGVEEIYSEKLLQKANTNSVRTVELPFTRGRILDRDGRLLSLSVPMYAIHINPKQYFAAKIKRTPKSWRYLANETGVLLKDINTSIDNFLKTNKETKSNINFDARSILNPKDANYWTLLAEVSGIDRPILIEKVKNNPTSEFVRLDNAQWQYEQEKWKALAKSLHLSYADLMNEMYKQARRGNLEIANNQYEAVMDYAKNLKFEGMTIKEETRRVYPLGEQASQLIGLTDDKSQNGQEGLERSFNERLIGKNGKQVYRRDRQNNVVENILTEKQDDPQDVTLSIDENLQSMVYREIKKAVKENNAESGTAVLIDVTTGEILAMATAPSFNSNNRSSYKAELQRNRAIHDTFEPGSTVKPLVVLTALQNGATYRDEIINTRPFIVNGKTITDVSPRESLSLTGILQKSSNVGVSRLALRMPSTALIETYNKVGFGKDTGLGLNERTGTNGDRKLWSDINRATLSYGYGLSVTPLQLARAYATLGSFGLYRPLSITKVEPPVQGTVRALPEKITRDVVKMMEAVAQKGEGGQKAMVDGYRVAVKTGTARKTEVINKKSVYVEKYLAYTAGIAPASDPRFALVVLINEPKAGEYYGGAVSAPLFSRIMGYALKAYNIKPDNLAK